MVLLGFVKARIFTEAEFITWWFSSTCDKFLTASYQYCRARFLLIVGCAAESDRRHDFARPLNLLLRVQFMYHYALEWSLRP